MTAHRTAVQTKIDNVIVPTIFIGILVSAILMIAIGGALLSYVERIRSKKTVLGIISVFTLSIVMSFVLINFLIIIPALAIIPAIILIILGLNSYSLKTNWDRKTARACFLAGIAWLLYCLYEFKMRAFPGSIRVDLLFIAPIIFGEAAIAFCVIAVHLTDIEKNELTTRSSR